MSSIDERVVGMKFDNAQFEQGIKATLASLEALNKSLKLEGATKGLSDVDAAANKMQLGHIATAVDDIANHFKAMSVIAITALATIANKAVTVGIGLVKSLSTDPVNDGLKEYETNINSIQTILSNTRWQNTGLNDVTDALNTLNLYSDQTIYNFSQMARNIGTFTAAGVKLDVAVSAIKGIANLAAVSGSSAEQASAAMYQLSQAIATGTLKLIDWNSVVNAGLGGKVFQDALIETARVHHIAVDKMIKDAGGFRGSLEKGWLTASVLTETLSHFTGDLNEKQLISLGYSKEQAKAIAAMGADAQNAATKVKTLSQLFGTLQESAGSGWAQTFSIIFGNFNEARDLFTSASNVLGDFIKSNADARNKVLQDWKDLNGRTILIEAIGNAFKALIAVLKPIKEAFRSVFPPTTGRDLADLTIAIRNFTERLTISADTADKLRRTFAGVFAIFQIGWEVIKQVVRVLGELLGVATEGSGGILEFTAKIGDFIVEIQRAIKYGEGLTQFFDNIERILEVPIRALQRFGQVLGSLFGTFDPDQASSAILDFASGIDPLQHMADLIVGAWAKVLSLFDNIWGVFEPLAQDLVGWFHEISSAVGGLNFESLLKAINTGAFAALVLMIHNALGKTGVGGIINELTSTLGVMQKTLKAATLLEIALAIGVLAAAIVALSTVNADQLKTALVAISAMFVQLLATLAILSQIPGNGVIKLYLQAAAMTALGVAINVLAIAVKVLSALSWQELIKGLVGVSTLLAAIVATANFLPDSAKLISTGVGLLVLAGAIKVLVSSVTDLSGLSWEEMAKGLAGVAGLLASLALFSQFASVNATGILSGAGIILLATGIKILASAMHDIATLSWEEIGKGMTALAGGLTLIGTALSLIPPTSVISAAGVLIAATSLKLIGDALAQMGSFSWGEIGKGLTTLAGALTIIGLAISLIPPTAAISAGGVLIVALALGMLADALKKMGDMKWGEILKGLTALAGILGIITIALNLMTGTLPGALALIIVAGALSILSGVLLVLGKMSWGEIIKGLVALAAAFAVLGIAAAVLTPVIPAMLGLGAAIALIGVGLALAGAGVFLFAAGLTALSVAGAAGTAAIVAIVSAVIGLIPTLVQQLGVALLILIDTLVTAIPKIVDLLITLIIALLKGIDKIAPQLAVTLLKLIVLLLKVLEEAIPRMVEAGLKILIGILEGIRDNIGKIIKVAGQIIENFLRGIGNALPGIVQAGVDLILSFIRGLTNAIKKNSEALGRAGGDLAVAIIEGMVRGLGAGIGRVADAAKNAAKAALHSAMDFLGISSPSKEFEKIGRYSNEGFAQGLNKFTHIVDRAAENVGASAIDSMRASLAGISSAIDDHVELSPTITPVIDLSAVKRDADKMTTMFNVKPIVVKTTLASAKQAADGIQVNEDLTAQLASDQAAAKITYNQYNTSPKALSAAEIYRNTKNQLSTAKGGLPT